MLPTSATSHSAGVPFPGQTTACHHESCQNTIQTMDQRGDAGLVKVADVGGGLSWFLTATRCRGWSMGMRMWIGGWG